VCDEKSNRHGFNMQYCRTNAKPNPADVKRHEQIEAELVELTAEIDHLKEQTAQLESTIKELHQKIMEAGGIQLRLQKVKVDGVREQIDLLNDRITKSIVSKSKAEKDVIRYAKSIQRQQQQVEEMDSQLEDLTKQIEENAKIADDIRKKAEECQNVSVFANSSLCNRLGSMITCPYRRSWKIRRAIWKNSKSSWIPSQMSLVRFGQWKSKSRVRQMTIRRPWKTMKGKQNIGKTRSPS
jgi:predicted  nucleic acid-binding Zn-ribbon protein